MKIVVLLKEVPDTYTDRALNLETGLADRGASDPVVDEINERALEVALAYADSAPGEVEVSVMTMAPATATASIRKGLAMGASSGVHIADAALLGAGLGLTAEVLAAAIRAQDADLIVAGNQSTDGAAGMLPTMLAELLGMPGLTSLSSVTIEPERVSGARASDSAVMQVSAPLPAIISITEELPDARFPNFKGIMAAKKKPLETRSLADLGIDAADISASRSIMLSISERPPRTVGVKVTDDGTAAQQLATFLAENRLV
ncbi:MAG: electron transfer flavoprotein subunit beta/FixA family protein [Ruaniaceae bacterium]|nr:electron transfer flavoprotein subunit beta/FixA family protein [Ruaniaceae bacterium]